jgi:hypothetical protein
MLHLPAAKNYIELNGIVPLEIGQCIQRSKIYIQWQENKILGEINCISIILNNYSSSIVSSLESMQNKFIFQLFYYFS